MQLANNKSIVEKISELAENEYINLTANFYIYKQKNLALNGDFQNGLIQFSDNESEDLINKISTLSDDDIEENYFEIDSEVLVFDLSSFRITKIIIFLDEFISILRSTSYINFVLTIGDSDAPDDLKLYFNKDQIQIFE